MEDLTGVGTRCEWCGKGDIARCDDEGWFHHLSDTIVATCPNSGWLDASSAVVKPLGPDTVVDLDWLGAGVEAMARSVRLGRLEDWGTPTHVRIVSPAPAGEVRKPMGHAEEALMAGGASYEEAMAEVPFPSKPPSDPGLAEAVTVVHEERSPMEHELKTWRSYFLAIENGTKLFEIRRMDRDYRVGDTLRLRETEYGSGEYTGREAKRTITYILGQAHGLGLMDGFALLSLAPTAPPLPSEDLDRLVNVLPEIAKFLCKAAQPLPLIADKYDDAKACYSAHNIMLNAANACKLSADAITSLRRDAPLDVSWKDLPGYPYLPCPICKGMEGCTTVSPIPVGKP